MQSDILARSFERLILPLFSLFFYLLYNMMRTRSKAKTVRIAICLLGILILGFSCRRELTEPVTVDDDPGLPLSAHITPNAFPQREIQLFVPEEISGKQNFQAASIYNVGSGLVASGTSGVTQAMKEIGGLVYEISNFKQSKARFDLINSDLLKLQNQVAELNADILTKGATIDYSVEDFNRFLKTNYINTYVAPVIDAMKSETKSDFMYWANTASAYYADSTNSAKISKMLELKDFAPNFASANYLSSSLPYAIKNVHDQISPPGGNGTQALRAFAMDLIRKGMNGVVHDSIGAMNAYQMLEDYFLMVVNYQLQAAAVYMNAAKMYDTKGQGLASSWWKETFAPTIADEITRFQWAVDFMVVNLSEYRNQDQFMRDMKYSDSGIAPPGMFYHVLARSQYVSNLLSAAVGNPYPILSGHILVPTRYLTNPKNPIVLKAGNVIANSTGDSIQSMLPYTCWDRNSAGQMECNPAFMWSVYHFAVPNPGPEWLPSAVPLRVTDDPITDNTWSAVPWLHSKPIVGEVTPYYYNTEKAGQSSLTRTDSNNFLFGYFAGAWQWGDLYLSNSKIDTSFQKITSPKYWFDFKNLNDEIFQNGYDLKLIVPFIFTTDDYKAQKGIAFSNHYDKSGALVATGTTTTTATSESYIIVDGNFTKVKTGALLNVGFGGMKAFAAYNVCYGMAGSGGDFITVNIGSKRKIVSETFQIGMKWKWVDYVEAAMNGDMVNKKWKSQKGVTNQGFGSVVLEPNKTYEPGIQYYYETENMKSRKTANISFTTSIQFVYEGFNGIPW